MRAVKLLISLFLTGLMAGLSYAPAALEAADAGASEMFQAGERAFSQGDFLRAAAYFEDARGKGSPGPAVHYNLGVCHYKLGNFVAAESAFRHLASHYPDMRGLAEYNLGLVLEKQGLRDEAQRAVQQARMHSSDHKLSRLADAMLARLVPPPAAPSGQSLWIGLVDLGLGHDDNVALIDDASLPAGQSTDSPFTELFALISGPFADESGLRLDASAYLVRYSDAGEFDQNVARIGGVYEWFAGDWRVEAGPYLVYSTLDGDGFEQRLAAGVLVDRLVSNTMTFGMSYAREEVEDIDSQFAYVAGSRDQLRLTLNRRGSAGRITMAYQLETNDRVDPNVSPTRNRLSFRYRWTVNGRWTLDSMLALRSSSFDDLVTPRDEDLTEVTLGGARTLASGWQVSGQYRWADNDSDADIFSYQRQRLYFGVSKSF